MSGQQPNPPKKRRWLPTVFLCALGGLVVTILPALAYRQYFIWQAGRRLAELEAELDRTDPGWRFEEILAARKKIPDEENSAPLVLAATDQLFETWKRRADDARAHGGEGAEYLFGDQKGLTLRLHQRQPNQRLTRDLTGELRWELTTLAPIVEKARALRIAPRSGRYTIAEARNPMRTTLPHMDKLRPICKLLFIDSIGCSDQGDCEAGLDRALTLLIAIRSLGDEPHLVSLLARFESIILFCKATETAMAQGQISIGQLDELSELLTVERDEGAALMATGVNFDRAALVRVFGLVADGELGWDDFLGNESPSSGWSAVTGWLFWRPLFRHGQSESLLASTDAVGVARLPPESQYQSIKAWQDLRNRQRSEKKSWSELSRAFTNASYKVMDYHLKARVLMDATLTALACERYRLRHGHWPDSIETLVREYLDAVPQDCFRSAPLVLRRLEDGVVIYSVGPDGEDDGGLIVRGERPPPRAPGVPGNEDLGFRLWSPNARRQPPPAPKEPLP